MRISDGVEMKKILYLHGFASSGASGTVELLRREFWERRARVGKHKWLNRRRDGAAEFHVTKETVEHFREMEAHQFEGILEGDRSLCYGLFGTNDELLESSNRELFDRHYPGMRQMFEGGHRMNADVANRVLIPFIRAKGLL